MKINSFYAIFSLLLLANLEDADRRNWFSNNLQ